MEIGYSNISSGQQTVSGSMASEQNLQTVKLQQTSDITNLSAGKLFQGEILDIKGAQVSIGLDNGQVIHAKIDGDVKLSVGQKMMFEVASNTGSHIEIKPATDLINPSPVLQKALQAANIPLTERNIQMVNSMLKEGMSIDKQSLNSMLRQFSINPGADSSVIVKLNKMGIAVTPENVAQFENYKNYEHRIVKEIDNVASNITKLLAETAGENKNQAVALNNKLLDILNSTYTNNMKSTNTNQNINVPMVQGQVQSNNTVNPDALQPAFVTGNQATEFEGILTNPQKPDSVNAFQTEESGIVADGKNGNLGNGAENLKGTAVNNLISNVSLNSEVSSNTVLNNNLASLMNNTEGVNASDAFLNGEKISESPENNSLIKSGQLLENVLTKDERLNLADKLKNIGADAALIDQVSEGTISKKEFLNLVKDLLGNQGTSRAAESLLQSKEYNEILHQVIKDQWLVEPENLKEPDKMSNFYKHMDEQTRQLSSILESFGKEASAAYKDLSNIRSNLNFMEQINQNFTYIQIPVQFSNEEAHSDLYVYTNKKNLRDKDGNLSVMLHLDMEILGTTDIYIQMNGNSVSANFSLDKNDSIQIVEDNMESFINRLEEMGYKASAKVGPLEKKQDFVEDFLEKDKIVTSLKRFAFDVRA